MRDLYLESLKHVSLALKNYTQINDLEHFAIFAPENYFLRNAFTENQLKPLGIRGEGLFKHLADLSLRKPLIFNEIKENLNLIDWYEDLEFDLTSDGYFTGRIKIKDVYLNEGAKYFNAQSANEGFLYLLFYLTLFSSDKTPAFFAIDNIDNALNPKLASDLILLLVRLAAKYNKQAIVTTHNPAILDGLNLHDAEQRLLVLWRNANGHTKAKRIEKKQLSPTGATVKLSEQFLRGYIGGLNF
jgi:AAA15 family ATPase/GTPase